MKQDPAALDIRQDSLQFLMTRLKEKISVHNSMHTGETGVL